VSAACCLFESLDMRRENVAAIIWATGYRYD
jgi:hypothetical protein